MKKIFFLALIVCILFSLVSCKNSPVNFHATYSADKIDVGETVVVSVSLSFESYDPEIQSLAIRPVFDADRFVLVGGEMLIDADIADFSNGIGCLAFEEPWKYKLEQTVMTFELLALSKTRSLEDKITFDVSVLDSNGQDIPFDGLYFYSN